MQDINRKIGNNNNNNNCSLSSPPPFFNSSSPLFHQERISQTLFSNGVDGLLTPTNRLSGDNSERGVNNSVGGTGNSSVVRNIPIRVLSTTDKQPREDFPSEQLKMDLTKTSNSSTNFTPLSSPDLRRHFASLFWTPQQAKRISERENPPPLKQQQKWEENNQNDVFSSREPNYSISPSRHLNNSSGFGNDSKVTYYSIPISQKEEEEKNFKNKNEQKFEKNKNLMETPVKNNNYLQQHNFINSDFNNKTNNNTHYSAIPFRRRKAGFLGSSISAISTPSLFHPREDEEQKSHYQNIQNLNSTKINSINNEKQQQPPPRPPNPPNNKLMENSLNKSTTTFPTNSNKLINETNVHKQNNNNYYKNNNNIFPSQHSLKHFKTAFSTPNNDNISNNSTQQIRNRSVETTDLSSRNGLKSFPLLPRRDSEPSIILFAAAETPQQSSFEQKDNKQHSKLNIPASFQSPINSTFANNNCTLEREKRGDEKIPTTTIASEDFSSILSTTPSLASSSSCSASISASPLASSSSNISTIKNNNQRQKIKSPSLAALRQFLRYRPMRKNSNSSNNSEKNNEKTKATSKGHLEETKSLASTNSPSNFSDSANNKEKQLQNYMSRSMTLTPSKLCLTKFATLNNKNNINSKDFDKVDAVEEAIRSLEQFDPSEFVRYQYHQDNNENNQKEQLIAIQSTTTQPKLYLAKAEQPVYLSQPFNCSVTCSPNLFVRPSSISSFSSLSSTVEDNKQIFNEQSNNVPSILHRGISTNSTAFSSSSGSATPTQTAVFVLDEPTSSSFNFSMEGNPNNKQFGINPPTNTTNTPRANSPTFNEDEINEENRNNEKINNFEVPPPRRGVTFNDKLVQHFYAPFDGPPPDYSESGDDSADDLEDDIYNAEELPEDEIDALDSLTDSEEFYLNNKIMPATSPSSSAALEAKAQLRKRFLCSQLNDCAKVIDIGAFKMNQFVNASLEIGGWRQSHILRHNLGAIRDTIYTVEIALDELVETLGRISLHRHDPRQAHLRLLLQPCEYSLTLLRRLRASLDSTGWLLSALSRPRGSVVGHDALDQVVALLSQVPRDCAKLVQWVSSLSAWSDPQQSDHPPAAVFLPSSSNRFSQKQQNSNNGLFTLPHYPLYRQPSPTSSLQNFYYSSSGGEEETRDKNLKGTTDIMDGGESTSSTTSSVQTTLEQPQKQTKHEQQQKQQIEQIFNERDNNMENTDLVLEEDDLASVLSIDSNTTTEGGQQQNCLNGYTSSLHSPPSRLSHFTTGGLSSKFGICRVNAELARSLAPEQRDLFRIWEPQVETHIDTICTIIEQFFVLLEENKEPTSSGFQKIQIVYIEGHSLVGIGRVICRDDAVLKHRPLIAFLERECSKLDSLLNECLADAKVAKSHSQNNQNNNRHSTPPQTVPAVRSMCKAVVSVSENIGHLRLFWRACCG